MQIAMVLQAVKVIAMIPQELQKQQLWLCKIESDCNNTMICENYCDGSASCESGCKDYMNHKSNHNNSTSHEKQLQWH